MFSYGIDPGLDFANMPMIREKYERLTRMHVYERQPYAGDLVFTAFFGSHQDAIAKGMAWRTEKKLLKWTVPYLPIDPVDVEELMMQMSFVLTASLEKVVLHTF